jgi:hypothetical protein
MTQNNIATERIERTGNLLKTWLPLPTIAAIALTTGPMLIWVVNQSRDIQDAARVASEAKVQVQQQHADIAALRLKEVEVLTKLAGIEAQLAEIKLIILRKPQ